VIGLFVLHFYIT